jgi:hypothetical protein
MCDTSCSARFASLTPILEAYNDEVEKASGPESDIEDEPFLLDDRHVAIDLPLQTNWFSRAEAGEAALSDNRALAMVQLSLRPVPDMLQRVRRKEDVVRVPEGTEASDDQLAAWPPGPIYYDVLSLAEKGDGRLKGTVRLPYDIEVIYPEREGQPNRRFAAREDIDVADLTFGGETLLIRWQFRDFDGDPVREAIRQTLKNAGADNDFEVIEKFAAAGDAPFRLWYRTRPSRLFKDPFSRFGYTPEDWAKYLNEHYRATDGTKDDNGKLREFVVRLTTPRPDARVQVLVDHLTRAFVVVRGGKEIAEEIEQARNALKARIYADTSYLQTYMAWAERFFAAAPIVERRGPDADDVRVAVPDLEDPARCTATAPKRTDPARLAPDGSGAFSYTHRVQEDWASQRVYAVRLVPRYWDMRHPGKPVPKPIFNPKWNEDGSTRPATRNSPRGAMSSPSRAGVGWNQSRSSAYETSSAPRAASSPKLR